MSAFLDHARTQFVDFFWRPQNYTAFIWFRKAFAATLCLNYCHLLWHKSDLFGSAGLLSAEVADKMARNWIIPLWAETEGAITFCLIGGVLLTLLLWRGWQVRWVALALFLIQVQIELRNPMILRGSDNLYRLFLFYLVLTPQSCHEGRMSAAWPLRLFQLQIVSLYLMAGVTKLFGETWFNGDAAALAIGSWDFSRFPMLAATWPAFLSPLLSWSVLLFEFGFPVAIWSCRLRSAAITAALAFHTFSLIFLNLPGWHVFMATNLLIWIQVKSDSNAKS